MKRLSGFVWISIRFLTLAAAAGEATTGDVETTQQNVREFQEIRSPLGQLLEKLPQGMELHQAQYLLCLAPCLYPLPPLYATPHMNSRSRSKSVYTAGESSHHVSWFSAQTDSGAGNQAMNLETET